MIRVFDSSALIALLRNEPGMLVAQRLLGDNPGACYAHAINVCEVYYDFARTDGGPVARQVINDLQTQTGLIIRTDMDTDFWQSAGLLKATLMRVSLADCLGLALAERLDAEFVTADHHELDAVALQAAELGLRPPHFIR